MRRTEPGNKESMIDEMESHHAGMEIAQTGESMCETMISEMDEILNTDLDIINNSLMEGDMKKVDEGNIELINNNTLNYLFVN